MCFACVLLCSRAFCERSYLHFTHLAICLGHGALTKASNASTPARHLQVLSAKGCFDHCLQHASQSLKLLLQSRPFLLD